MSQLFQDFVLRREAVCTLQQYGRVRFKNWIIWHVDGLAHYKRPSFEPKTTMSASLYSAENIIELVCGGV